MMDGVDPMTCCGIFMKNVETLTLRNVTVKGQKGDAVITDGIERYTFE